MSFEAAPGRPDVVRVRASNPGPMTLTGTNTYVVATDEGAWVVDPGPADPEHIEGVARAADERGGIAGVVLTHSHADHSAGVDALGASLAWGEVAQVDEASGVAADASPARDGSAGPFEVVATPGHAHDHVCFVYGEVVFCGDLVLGEGSSIVPPAAMGGSLADYMESLQRLGELDSELLCPGHGPWIDRPLRRIAEYAAHRRLREKRLLVALEDGVRDREAMLDAAWSDVPAELRAAAAVALQAHLEKLAAEGRLPDGMSL